MLSKIRRNVVFAIAAKEYCLSYQIVTAKLPRSLVYLAGMSGSFSVAQRKKYFTIGIVVLEAHRVITIEMKGVSKTFKGNLHSRTVKALECLDFEINQGEVFGFLGPNGAGKSSAIKILINLIYPDSGSATILGLNVREKEARRHVGYLPENPYFYDYLNAEELLWFAGSASGLKKQAIQERTDTLLSKVNLQEARKRQIRTYSKGMVQRIGLAMALIHDPHVAILDEPMSGLDPIGRKMVGDLILELKSQGKTVFFSSHILTDIERFCDRVGIIVNGKLRLVDTIRNILIGDTTLEDVFLREANSAGRGVEL